MNRPLALIVGLVLAAPALAQEYGEAPPPPQDNGSYYGDQAPQPPPDDAQVDVSVDMGNPGATVTYDTFRDGLSPYGEWVDAPGYGRVWRPHNVAADWRPYYHGRWEWTDEGWLWVSDEAWGWATYHYGRWAFEPSYGWVWIPGYQWAPAWVTWRYSPDYIGWAPLGPGFSVYVSSYPAVFNWWTFVPCTRFVGVPVFTVAYAPHFVPRIFHATYPAPPRAAVFGARAPAWGGPALPVVERRIGRPITPVRVQAVGSPTAIGAARAGVVPIYRPELRGRPFTPSAPPRPAAAAPGRGGFVAPGAPAAPNRAFTAPPRPAGQAAPAPAPRPAGQAPAAAPRPAAPAPRQGGQPAAALPRQGGVWRGPVSAAPRAQGSFGGPRPMGGFAPPRAQGGFSPPHPQAVAPRPAQGGGGGHAAPAQHRR
jgi:hypothetical protein